MNEKESSSTAVDEEVRPYPEAWQRLPAEELQQRIGMAVAVFNDVKLSIHKRLPAKPKVRCKYNKVSVVLDVEESVPPRKAPGNPGGEKAPAYKHRLRCYEAHQGPLAMWMCIYEYPDSEKPTCTTIRISFKHGKKEPRNVFCAEYKKGDDALHIRYCILPENCDWVQHVNIFATNTPKKKGAWHA